MVSSDQQEGENRRGLNSGALTSAEVLTEGELCAQDTRAIVQKRNIDDT